MKTLNTKHKYYVSTYIIQKFNLSIYNHTAIFYTKFLATHFGIAYSVKDALNATCIFG